MRKLATTSTSFSSLSIIHLRETVELRRHLRSWLSCRMLSPGRCCPPSLSRRGRFRRSNSAVPVNYELPHVVTVVIKGRRFTILISTVRRTYRNETSLTAEKNQQLVDALIKPIAGTVRSQANREVRTYWPAGPDLRAVLRTQNHARGGRPRSGGYAAE